MQQLAGPTRLPRPAPASRPQLTEGGQPLSGWVINILFLGFINRHGDPVRAPQDAAGGSKLRL